MNDSDNESSGHSSNSWNLSSSESDGSISSSDSE